MAEHQKPHHALSDDAARQLANATKTPPFCDGSHNKLGTAPKRGWSLLAGRKP